MKKVIFTSLVFFALISQFAFAEVIIKGRLLTENQQPIVQAKVSLSGSNTNTDKQGYYQINVADADIYRLDYSKEGFYPSVQTFSHFELTNQAAPLTIADITLVEKAEGRVMFAFGGDAMMGRRYYKPYFGDEVLIHNDSRIVDSRAVIENVKPYMSLADIAAVNLETQIFANKPGDAAPKSVAFYSKPEILDALTWAGIDYVTLGNNHTYDYKKSGLETSLKHMRESKLAFSGAGINEEEALKAHVTNINGVDYGMLGYVGWEGRADPNQVAEHDKGGAAFGSLNNIIASVGKQVDAGRVPVVQYHGSQEYTNNPTGVTEKRLKAAIDHGAALAIAHHPHVTQGIELYKGKLIAYSMGNFIFDQYIPSTPYSFLLYVWMDKGEFHRAEIVPIYLKGYKPTPATGINRYTTMKRITTLSAQRNTHIGLSGGHGVISTEQTPSNNQSATISFPENTRTAPLYLLPWQKNLAQVNTPKNVSYRLGINLINGSDFESFDTFNSNERSWFFDREHTVINNYGASGNKSLGVTVNSNQTSTVGMQAFRRKFKGDIPTTVTAKVKTDNVAKISFYWQGRRYGQGFFQARKESEKQLIGSVDLQGKSAWQTIELDFESVRHNYPSKGYRSYRVIAEIELTDGRTGKVDIDDFAAIEWQSAFTELPTPFHTSVESKQASYIGISKSTSETVKITFQ
ncbi:CapA family protein [Thalassotalea fonticola]|uniref:CapA family protein n=1 Tax=Thalassotalea fonticola TaxID=3065649 RepID=A0ABZ0GN99_9GAMM|nr:CapA family protein [Colwelliaceae bacterium S1-1]